MHLTTLVRTKIIEETEPGELIKILVGFKLLLALVLKNDDGRRTVGILDAISDEVDYPVHTNPANSKSCLSFGNDWMLEPKLTPVSWPGHTRYNWAPGALFLSGDRYLTVFRNHESSYLHGEILFDLTGRVCLDSFPQNAAPIVSWKIWENQADYQRAGSTPLFEVSDVKIVL